MKAQRFRSRAIRWTIGALLAAGAGIVIQIAGGADYPPVPPGLVLLTGAAGLVAFGRWRWTPIVGVLVGLFLFAGLFAAGRAPALVDPSAPVDALGLWIQVLAVVVAIAAGITAALRNYRRGPSAADPGPNA